MEVKQLTKAFQQKTAIQNVSFKVKKGEIFGLLGPSGSGKTTMVKILTSQLLPTNGTVRVFEQDIKQTGNNYLQRIGVLTDNSGLYERLSIYENLVLFSKLYGIDASRIEEVLHDVNLIEDKTTMVKKLSKGMKQRVTLARAILHKPDLLFLDEPTSALDPVNAQHIHRGLQRLNEAGTTIFLTTHNMQEAEQLCDRVAFLHQGNLVELDTPERLRLRYADQTIEITLQNNEKETVGMDEAGSTKIQNYIKEGRLVAIHSNEPTLGDVFIRLTGRDLV